MRLAAALLLCALAGAALAEPQAGREYQPVEPPQPVAAAGKVEVIEFFYYGCPHCFDLQPQLKGWLKRAPADVAFRRVPVYRDSWLPLSKLYYTLEALDALRLHEDVYETLHIRNLDLREETVILDWAARVGLDRQRFQQAWDSDAVEAQVRRSREMTRAYGITGTPQLVVNGAWRTGSAMAGGHAGLIGVLDALIVKARGAAAARP